MWKEENIKKLNGNPPTLTDDSSENWKKINENNNFALVHGGNDIGVNTIGF